MASTKGTFNRVILMGRLGKDPEVKFTDKGTAVCNFSLATNHKVGDSDVADWHKVVVWGKQAESCGEFLKKGSLACVEGELQYRSWDKDGTKMYATEVIASHVTFMDSKKATSKEGGEVTPPVGDDGLPF